MADVGEAVEQFGEDIAELLTPDLTAEEEAVSTAVEDILTRLDEIASLVDMIRSDSALCFSKALPGVEENSSAQLPDCFDAIDRIQEDVDKVKTELDRMESRVTHAESVMRQSFTKRLFNL